MIKLRLYRQLWETRETNGGAAEMCGTGRWGLAKLGNTMTFGTGEGSLRELCYQGLRFPVFDIEIRMHGGRSLQGTAFFLVFSCIFIFLCSICII